MSRRRRLNRNILLLCSVPLLVVALLVIGRRLQREAPYVAGSERQGITRSLDRQGPAAAGGIRFTEVSAAAGIDFEHAPWVRTSQLPEDMGSGAAWGDFDGDGWPDLFLVNNAAPLGVADSVMATAAATDRLYRNRGDGTFADVTAAAGVGAAHRGMGAAWGDADADGDLDLCVTGWGECILWENRGDGTFADVTAAAGLAGRGFWTGASWADFDLDGDLDLYICGYVQYVPEKPGSAATRAGGAEFPFTLNPSSYPPHPNRLFVNRGDGTFDEAAAAAGVVGASGRSLAAAWADFDADGLPDLYVANDVSDNQLFLNRGDGTFRDASYEAMVADYRGAMGVAVGDWDDDLDLDIFITHWIAQENALYSNLRIDAGAAAAGGAPLAFADEADQHGLGQIALDLIGWGTAFTDVDSDGRLDLLVVNGSTFQRRDDPTQLIAMDPHLYWNRGPAEGFFEIGEAAGIRSAPPGVGRGAAFADYDHDGDQDLVIVRHGGRARLLRNDSRGGHWIALRLRGTSGHPAAIGARVVLWAGGRAQLREVGAGPSYLSQNDPELLIGLGGAVRADSLRIDWPRGGRERWRELAANRRWRLVEGRAPEPLETAAVGTAAATAAGPAGSPHAVVARLDSPLDREQQQRFWQQRRAAERLFAAGDWEAAAAAFGRLSALDPRHEDALYRRGNCLLELGRYAEAIACWERLLEVNPASARAWRQIGIVHTLPAAAALYDLRAAGDAFAAAHRLNREESGALELLGEVALARGDLEAARSALAAARRMNPRAAAAFYLGGYLAWKADDAPGARELLAAARASSERPAPPPGGVAGEGDTRGAHMQEARQRAASRRLFDACVEALRQAGSAPSPDEAFACVEETLAGLPPPPPRP